jgi:hypothetical protein
LGQHKSTNYESEFIWNTWRAFCFVFCPSGGIDPFNFPAGDDVEEEAAALRPNRRVAEEIWAWREGGVPMGPGARL